MENKLNYTKQKVDSHDGDQFHVFLCSVNGVPRR